MKTVKNKVLHPVKTEEYCVFPNGKYEAAINQSPIGNASSDQAWFI